MPDEDAKPNANEGADPSDDIRKQNPGETTTADLAERPAKSDDDDGPADPHGNTKQEA